MSQLESNSRRSHYAGIATCRGLSSSKKQLQGFEFHWRLKEALCYAMQGFTTLVSQQVDVDWASAKDHCRNPLSHRRVGEAPGFAVLMSQQFDENEKASSSKKLLRLTGE